MSGVPKMDHDVPIRIVKKKKGHGGHHGGAWKVAYADFVTAMMALFIVLWIVGQSRQVKAYVADYFKDPGAFFENTKGGGQFESGRIPIGERVTEPLLKSASDSIKQQMAFENAGRQIRSKLEEGPEIKDLARQIDMHIVKDGLRIELLEKSESFFFDVGTTTLKPEAKEILTIIAQELGKLPNHIVIEGHTDGRPYSAEGDYSNFELSAERANTARRVLVAHGVSQKQIDEVRGYADTKLRNQTDPYDVTNRRISILVKFAAEAPHE
jgi:chemotaxis protein MotB